MDKNDSLGLIYVLEDKIQMLIKKHIELEKLYDSLRDKNSQLKIRIGELQEQMENIEREKTIQALHVITDEQQKEQLKRYLDVLIKNLDENIKLLK